MRHEPCAFERYMKNVHKREKQRLYQKTTDETLMEMKKKYEQQQKEKLTKAKKDLEILIKGGI